MWIRDRANPWYDQGRLRAQIWSLGHRNPLGIAFDGAGRLWEIEMGPRGGDEVNLVVRGANYGWPRASNGTHYDGRDIPDHRAGAVSYTHLDVYKRQTDAAALGFICRLMLGRPHSRLPLPRTSARGRP